MNCQIRFNPCSNQPCQNGGLCNIDGEDYVCTCPLTFGGKILHLIYKTTFNPVQCKFSVMNPRKPHKISLGNVESTVMFIVLFSVIQGQNVQKI